MLGVVESERGSSVQTSDVVDWEFFRINDDYYLAAAAVPRHVTSADDQVSAGSTVYRLDKVRKQFDVYQRMTTHRSVARGHYGDVYSPLRQHSASIH